MRPEFYEEMYPKIYNYVYYRLLNRENAEDITSEVFLKAIANESRYDRKRGAESTWLFTIAHNCVANFYRSQKSHMPLDRLSDEQEKADLTTDNKIDDNLILQEDCLRLYMLLKTFTERERTIVALRFWGGFSHAEIAKKMNLSKKNIGVILSRTIAKLRTLW